MNKNDGLHWVMQIVKVFIINDMRVVMLLYKFEEQILLLSFGFSIERFLSLYVSWLFSSLFGLP